MLNIGRILHQDRLLRATTGLNRRAFETLLEKFEQVYLAAERGTSELEGR
jgi:hypothetical protein